MSEASAWSVERLAKAWDCDRSTIYKMIDAGELHAFPIGRRGLRISDQEKQRCENRNAKSTATETSPSETDQAPPLPTTAMRMISAGGRA